MALSNKFGAIVLSTGNKSELGVGYCTLYGDMVGGLAVISDVPKTLVYRLSHYVNSRAPVIPQASLEKPPSAELRPDQKDSDTLPPYEVLDAILEDYVEDSHTAEQIAADHGFDLALVRRVIRWWIAANTSASRPRRDLKISPKAFGYGRRFPIAAKTGASERCGNVWVGHSCPTPLILICAEVMPENLNRSTASSEICKTDLWKGTHASRCSILFASSVDVAFRGRTGKIQVERRPAACARLQHQASFGRNGECFPEADVRLRSVGVVESRFHPAHRSAGNRRSDDPLEQSAGAAEQPPVCHL